MNEGGRRFNATQPNLKDRGIIMSALSLIPSAIAASVVTCIFAVAAYTVFFLAAFALPETRGRILHADA